MKYRWNIANYDKKSPGSAQYGRHYAEIFKETYTPELRAEFLAQLRLAFPVEDYSITVAQVMTTHREIELTEPTESENTNT